MPRAKSCVARLLAKLIRNVSTGVQTRAAMFVGGWLALYLCMLSQKFERTTNRREFEFATYVGDCVLQKS